MNQLRSTEENCLTQHERDGEREREGTPVGTWKLVAWISGQASFYLTLPPIIHKIPVFLKPLRVLGKFVLLGISKMPPSNYICTASEGGISAGRNFMDVHSLSLLSAVRSPSPWPWKARAQQEQHTLEGCLSLPHFPSGPRGPIHSLELPNFRTKN